jgi:hypothetical protein
MYFMKWRIFAQKSKPYTIDIQILTLCISLGLHKI